MYKVNIHAHTVFSDGYNSPVSMAIKAKELGFSSLVLTDHFYGEGYADVSLSNSKLVTYQKAVKEAKEVLPVIVGIEIPFMGQEILVFGGGVVKNILANGLPDTKKLLQYKKDNHCAFVLCHPSEGFEDVVEYVDGYERVNGVFDMFKNNRCLHGLEKKQAWYNSDAHTVSDLYDAHTIVDKKITKESDLISYIVKQKNTSNGV